MFFLSSKEPTMALNMLRSISTAISLLPQDLCGLCFQDNRRMTITRTDLVFDNRCGTSTPKSLDEFDSTAL